jgi:hypothetical protein
LSPATLRRPDVRLDVRALLSWAALIALLYAGGLGAWQGTQLVYLRALERGVTGLHAVGVLPAALQAVVVPDRGLAIVGAGLKGFAVPHRILGADLALAMALIVSTPWLLGWRDRVRRGCEGLGFVFVLHLATIVVQTWVNMSTSTSVWATWNLWTTLYQGKVVPIAIWALLVGLPRLRRTRRPRTAPQAR